MKENRIFKVPVNFYDPSTGETNPADRYFSEEPLKADEWQKQMLCAQKRGKRISYSGEWSGAQRYFALRHPEQELKLVDNAAYTGTVFDFADETLKEGITLNDDGTIAGAKTILGAKDGIILPHSSAYVKDLDDRHMKLVAYLHGLKDPKREIPDYAYLWIDANDIKPVVRGYRNLLNRANRRVSVDADYGPADRRFAAWLVDDTKPENVITPEEHEAMQARLAKSVMIME